MFKEIYIYWFENYSNGDMKRKLEKKAENSFFISLYLRQKIIVEFYDSKKEMQVIQMLRIIVCLILH